MAANTITGIDHLVVGVKSLAEAVDTYARLGFALTPYGQHEGMGTGNHCIMMPHDYIELVGVSPEAADSELRRRLTKSLESRGNGVMAVAFHTEDGAATHQALVRKGVAAAAPQSVIRTIGTKPQPVRAALSMVRLPEDALVGLSAFVAQHLSPEAVRRPGWMAHPNGAVGLDSLTLIVDDPMAAKDAYESFFGAGVAAITDHTVAVHLGDHTIFLCSADQLTQLHPDVELDDAPKPPAPVAIGIKVRDIEETARVLAANRVGFRMLKEGMIRVPPSETLGTLIEFCEG
ncbi:Dioxygenase [uncultured Alphaproteobacteria bacterium]|uniref:Dioxygenase n=1 Tax=uncultured Alphaproteobacteria bacterium TaxID=91750 RepID=A0A212JWQ6_9PROT|nr:Dioxygenase [uncultured Alphaproteobacteria bacterium]